jgi:hypothetical protein
MDVKGERRIAAPRERVWGAINDPAVLRRCIPGCESLERLNDQDLRATVAAQLGPVHARFSGTLAVTDAVPPRGCRIAGEGDAGSAGFARGEGTLTLEEDGKATRLSFQFTVTLGGRLAQVGARLLEAAARALVREFLDRLDGMVIQGPAVADDAGGGLPVIVWAPALILVMLAVLGLILSV